MKGGTCDTGVDKAIMLLWLLRLVPSNQRLKFGSWCKRVITDFFDSQTPPQQGQKDGGDVRLRPDWWTSRARTWRWWVVTSVTNSTGWTTQTSWTRTSNIFPCWADPLACGGLFKTFSDTAQRKRLYKLAKRVILSYLNFLISFKPKAVSIYYSFNIAHFNSSFTMNCMNCIFFMSTD